MKTPLKTILKNFLNHVEDLEARKALSDDQYEVEFQKLKHLTEQLKEDVQFSCLHGQKDVNRPKNRYKDILPYDFSRVVLPEYSGIPGSDYINASYIKGASGALAYIAAQGPLPNTVIDFWRMIWDSEVQVVIMACNEREAGKYKCEAYWAEEGQQKQYGNICVELIKWTQVCPDFLVRTLKVSEHDEVREVCQFHYTTWPDHGVPDTVQPILELVRLIRDCQASETVPVLVHCSAGCGRTGTICSIDFVWACLRTGRLSDSFSLYNIVAEMRQQRIAMVQTKEQYVLVHKAVAAMFEQQLRVIDCHTYENVDEDGEPLMWKELEKSGNEEPKQYLEEKEIITGKEVIEIDETGPSDSKQIITLEEMNKLPNECNRERKEGMENLSSSSKIILNLDCMQSVPNSENKSLEAKESKKDFSQSLVLSPISIDVSHSYKNNIKDDVSKVTDCSSKDGLTDVEIANSKDGSVSLTCEGQYLKQKYDTGNKYECDKKIGYSDLMPLEAIPFIDDDEQKADDPKIRTQGGRAYLNIPSCDSISELINTFDPFADKLSLCTDDSSPDTEGNLSINDSVFITDKLTFSEEFERNQSKSDISPYHCDKIEIHSNTKVAYSSSEVTKNCEHSDCRAVSDINEPFMIYSYSDSKVGKNNVTSNNQIKTNVDCRNDSNEPVSSAESFPDKLVTNTESCALNKKRDFQNTQAKLVQQPEVRPNNSEKQVTKIVGKATVIRRPSIAKLKALFEKSGNSSVTNEKGKVNENDKKISLFRHHTHHVTRSGSAPPCLSCGNKCNESEKESILEMVTRKFRSSSVKTEYELQKQNTEVNHLPVQSKSENSTVKKYLKGNISISRNASLNFTKGSTSTSNSLSQTKWYDSTARTSPADLVKFDRKKEKIQWCDAKQNNKNICSKIKSYAHNKSLVSEQLEKSYNTEPALSPTVPTIKNFPVLKYTVNTSVDNHEQGHKILSPITAVTDNLPNQFQIGETCNFPDSEKKHILNKEQNHSSLFGCIEIKQKLNIPFCSAINRKTAKDPSAMWYNEMNVEDKSTSAPENGSVTISTKRSDAKPNLEMTHSVASSSEIAMTESCDEVRSEKIDDTNNENSLEPENPNIFKSEINMPKVFSKSMFYTYDDTVSEKPPSLPQKKRISHALGQLISPLCSKSEEENSSSSRFFWPPHSLSSPLSAYSEINKSSDVESKVLNQNNNTDTSKVYCSNINFADIKPPSIYVNNVNTPQNINVCNVTKDINTNDELMHSNKGEKPPALPRKMVIGKNRNVDFPLLTNSDEDKTKNEIEKKSASTYSDTSSDNTEKESSDCEKQFSENIQDEKNISLNKNDVYINVNLIAKKNIEQIENTLRNHPRGAIIDLTSRQSYSMEEELANAVHQLSEESEIKSEGVHKTEGAKYPGYEVIWPDSTKDKSKTVTERREEKIVEKCKLKEVNISEFEREKESLKSFAYGKRQPVSHKNKTGLCYSPPLRRNVYSTFPVSKSQSCVSLDWLELENKNNSALGNNLGEVDSESTETLVNEAVAELNTLLDQLTTRTLSEDIGFKENSNSPILKENISIDGGSSKEPLAVPVQDTGKTIAKESVMKEKHNFTETSEDHHKCIKVTSKAGFSLCSSKDDEIIFHFPPPPPLPPPPQDDPIHECFDVVCKDGVLLVSEANKDENANHQTVVHSTNLNFSGSQCQEKSYNLALGNANEEIKLAPAKQINSNTPTPVPRKTKQNHQEVLGNLRKSASYTTLVEKACKNNGSYENVPLDRCQTLPRLQGNEAESIKKEEFSYSQSFSTLSESDDDFKKKLIESHPNNRYENSNSIFKSKKLDYEVIFPVLEKKSFRDRDENSKTVPLTNDSRRNSSDCCNHQKSPSETTGNLPSSSSNITAISLSEEIFDKSDETTKNLKAISTDDKQRMNLLPDKIVPIRNENTHQINTKVRVNSMPPLQRTPLQYKEQGTKSGQFHNNYENSLPTSNILSNNDVSPPKINACREKDSENNKDQMACFHKQACFKQVNLDQHSLHCKARKPPQPKTHVIVSKHISSEVPGDFEKTQSNTFDHLCISEKKRLPPSRKTERAPQPPVTKIIDSQTETSTSSLHCSNKSDTEIISKKLPSRKLEKAPQPPLLHHSASSKSLSLNKGDANEVSADFPVGLKTQKLSALYENMTEVHMNIKQTDVTDSTQNKDIAHYQKKSVHGLQHSHSDASVFLALRGRKLRPLGRNQDSSEKKPLPLPQPQLYAEVKPKSSSSSSTESSSDSDSSLKKISLTQSTTVLECQPSNVPVKTEKQNVVPVAPPRSKRRSTMEIHYLKARGTEGMTNSLIEISSSDPTIGISSRDPTIGISSRDPTIGISSRDPTIGISSDPTTTNQLLRKNNTRTSSDELPPAIPAKTKDAYEVPEEFKNKAATLPNDGNVQKTNKRQEIRRKPLSKDLAKISEKTQLCLPALSQSDLTDHAIPLSLVVEKKDDNKNNSVETKNGTPGHNTTKEARARKPLQ